MRKKSKLNATSVKISHKIHPDSISFRESEVEIEKESLQVSKKQIN